MVVEALESVDNELCRVVLDGDGPGELRPTRCEVGERRGAAYRRGEFVECDSDGPVLVAGEADDFCTEVGECLSVRLVVNEADDECAAAAA
mgnify:FL=1